MSGTLLDAIVQRLQTQPPFNIYAVKGDGSVTPWHEVTDIINDLVIRQNNLEEQVESIGCQIQFWGRMAALTQRVWEIEERNYRIWRDGFKLATMENSKKKLTLAAVDMTVRQEPDYKVYWERIERASEAHSCANAVLDGFRAKKDMLKTYVMRSREDGAARLSV